MNRVSRANELVAETPHEVDDLVFIDNPDPTTDEPVGTYFLIRNPTKDDRDERNLWDTEVSFEGEQRNIGTALLNLIPIDDVPQELPPALADRDDTVFWVAYDYEDALHGEFTVLEDESTIGLD